MGEDSGDAYMNSTGKWTVAFSMGSLHSETNQQLSLALGCLWVV